MWCSDGHELMIYTCYSRGPVCGRVVYLWTSLHTTDVQAGSTHHPRQRADGRFHQTADHSITAQTVLQQGRRACTGLSQVCAAGGGHAIVTFKSFHTSHVSNSLVRWGVGSILHGVDPLSYFLFQPVLHDWCNKGRGM